MWVFNSSVCQWILCGISLIFLNDCGLPPHLFHFFETTHLLQMHWWEWPFKGIVVVDSLVYIERAWVTWLYDKKISGHIQPMVENELILWVICDKVLRNLTVSSLACSCPLSRGQPDMRLNEISSYAKIPEHMLKELSRYLRDCGWSWFFMKPHTLWIITPLDGNSVISQ